MKFVKLLPYFLFTILVAVVVFISENWLLPAVLFTFWVYLSYFVIFEPNWKDEKKPLSLDQQITAILKNSMIGEYSDVRKAIRMISMDNPDAFHIAGFDIENPPQGISLSDENTALITHAIDTMDLKMRGIFDEHKNLKAIILIQSREAFLLSTHKDFVMSWNQFVDIYKQKFSGIMHKHPIFKIKS